MANKCGKCGTPFWDDGMNTSLVLCKCRYEAKDIMQIQLNDLPPLKNTSSFQTCPICFGSGRVPNTLGNAIFETCTVCEGEKIISTLTGRPPKKRANGEEK